MNFSKLVVQSNMPLHGSGISREARWRKFRKAHRFSYVYADIYHKGELIYRNASISEVGVKSMNVFIKETPKDTGAVEIPNNLDWEIKIKKVVEEIVPPSEAVRDMIEQGISRKERRRLATVVLYEGKEK